MNFLKQALPIAAILTPFVINFSTQPSLAFDPECRTLDLTTDLSPGGADDEINSRDGCYKTPNAYVVEAYKLGL